MSKLVCHMGKYSKGNVFGLQKHNQRENANYSNENIDINKSENNYDLANTERINYKSKIDKIIADYRKSNRAVRKDAIVYVETIISSDKEFFKGMTSAEQKRFFQESYNYLSDKIGRNNIVSANVHLDEVKGVGGTPHMHLGFVPITEDGRLSAKTMINRNFLREVQAEFPRYLKNKGFNIERGMENSINKHLQPLAYKKQEVQKVSERLSKAKNEMDLLGVRLVGIEAKESVLGHKVTISKEDYNELIDLAHIGQESIRIKNYLDRRVKELEGKLKNYSDLADRDYSEITELTKERDTYKGRIVDVTETVKKMGADVVREFNEQYKQRQAEKEQEKLNRARTSRSFDRDR